MADARPSATAPLAFVAVGLVVLGLGLWGLFALTRGGEPHAYAPDAQAPYSVHLTQGTRYQLAVPHGTDTGGLGQGAADCSFVASDGSTHVLTVEPNSGKAIDQAASFVAPRTGTGHVQCAGLAQVFVDDADDASFDRSGLFLLLATISLAVGLPLLLSVARTAMRAADHTEVEV